MWLQETIFFGIVRIIIILIIIIELEIWNPYAFKHYFHFILSFLKYW